jgi:hypothetical protein
LDVPWDPGSPVDLGVSRFPLIQGQLGKGKLSCYSWVKLEVQVLHCALLVEVKFGLNLPCGFCLDSSIYFLSALCLVREHPLWSSAVESRFIVLGTFIFVCSQVAFLDCQLPLSRSWYVWVRKEARELTLHPSFLGSWAPYSVFLFSPPFKDFSGWCCDSNDRSPALQEWSPKFKLQYLP